MMGYLNPRPKRNFFKNEALLMTGILLGLGLGLAFHANEELR
jgi:hypothetical protein